MDQPKRRADSDSDSDASSDSRSGMHGCPCSARFGGSLRAPRNRANSGSHPVAERRKSSKKDKKKKEHKSHKHKKHTKTIEPKGAPISQSP